MIKDANNTIISENNIKNKTATSENVAVLTGDSDPVKNKKLLEIDIDKDFYFNNNIIVVNINIENIPVKMIIDTGSSYDILAESFFIDNNIDKPVVSRTKLLTLSGEQTSPNVNVEFEINDDFKKSALVCVTKVTFDQNYNISGIIGLETLIDFKTIIDLNNFKLIFNI